MFSRLVNEMAEKQGVTEQLNNQADVVGWKNERRS